MRTASHVLAKATGYTLDPSGENHVPAAGSIHGIAIRFGFVLCGNMATSALNFIDPATGLLAYTLQLPHVGGPEGLRGVDGTATRIIQVDAQAGNLYSIIPPINGQPPVLEGTVTGLNSPRAVRTDVDGNIWVCESPASGLGTVCQLNAAGIVGTVSRNQLLMLQAQVGLLPYYPDINRLTNKLWVPNQLGAECSLVDMTTGAVTTHATGARPYECHNDGMNMLITEHGDGQTDGLGVLILPLGQTGWGKRISIGNRADALAGIRRRGGRIYACCSGTDRVVSFDADAQDTANADIRFISVEVPGGSPTTTPQHPAMLDTDNHDLWVSILDGQRAWRLRNEVAWP